MLSDLIKSCFLLSCHQNHLKFGMWIHCVMPHTIWVISSSSCRKTRPVAEKSLRFMCFGNHRRAVCKEDSPCKSCGRRSHHTLMCFPKGSNDLQSTHVDEQTVANPMNPVNWVEAPPFPDPSLNAQSNAAQGSSGLTMYAIYSAPVTSSKNEAIIFCDDGSDTSFISHNAVKKFKVRHLENINVEIDTLAGTKSLSTNIYEVTIITCNGKKRSQ